MSINKLFVFFGYILIISSFILYSSYSSYSYSKKEKRVSTYKEIKELTKVNRVINSYSYIPEEDEGTKDHWKTSEEFYKDGGGDCEDFAIAKYDLLKNNHSVAIAVGYYNDKPKQYHAVLLVDSSWILDSNLDEVVYYDIYCKYFTIIALTDTKKNRID